MRLKIYPFILIALSLLPLFSLFHPGMFSGHDSESHVARLVAFYQSLSEGNIIPRWAGNFNMGYGHPVLMFLYPLSNYLGSFWHFLGFSFIDSVKITFGFVYILSGLFMYLFVNELFGKKAGFLASILYLFAPYRFVDLYVRAALGEHLAFTFMPLVLWSFLKLIKVPSSKFLILSSLSLAFLILSHNAISLMFLPFFFLFLMVVIFARNDKEGSKLKAISYVLMAIFLGFSLSAFFWLPAFWEGKYTLRDIVTKNEYSLHFPELSNFFYSSWSYGGSQFFSKEIGYAGWILVILGLIYLIIKRGKKDFTFWLMGITEAYFWLTFLLMNKISLPVWQIVTILQKFQFPWRFLSMSILTTSLLTTATIFFFQTNRQKKLIVLVLSLLTIIPTISYWQPKGYLPENDNYFIREYSGTTDTGESTPRWTIRGMEKKPVAELEIIDGKASLARVKRTTTEHTYLVKADNKVRLVDNTVYFPGWEVLVDGKKIDIEFQDPNFRGLITFYVFQGEHQVVVKFRETKLRLVADFISSASLIAIFGILLTCCRLFWPRTTKRRI